MKSQFQFGELRKSVFEEANVMKSTDKIIDYLKKTYQPESIIVYGSFADGSANLNSDFDALIIAGKEKLHDSSFVDGVVLDVFIYPPDQFLSEYDPAEFAQVWDGKIILDKNGMGGWLKKNVLDYIEHIPLKTAKDVSQEIKWCEKMLLRTMRGDVEGYYRWHWLLCDSLEIYFDIKGIHYYGPKKALHFMEESDSEAFHIYSKALLEFNQEGLSDWIMNRSPSSRQLKKYKFFLPVEIYLLAVFMQLASKFHVFPLALKFQDSFASVYCCSNLYNLRSFFREYLYR